MSGEKSSVHDLRFLIKGRSENPENSRSRQRSRSYSDSRQRSGSYSRSDSRYKSTSSPLRSDYRHRRSEDHSRRKYSSRSERYSRHGNESHARSMRSRSLSPIEYSFLSSRSRSPLNIRKDFSRHEDTRKWYKNLEVKVVNQNAVRDDVRITVSPMKGPEKYLEDCGISVDEIVKDVIASNNLADPRRLFDVVAENNDIKRCMNCRKILKFDEHNYCENCKPMRAYDSHYYPAHQQVHRSPLLVSPPMYSARPTNSGQPAPIHFNPIPATPAPYVVPPHPLPFYSNSTYPPGPRHYQAPMNPSHINHYNRNLGAPTIRHIRTERPSTSPSDVVSPSKGYQNVKKEITKTIKHDSIKINSTQPIKQNLGQPSSSSKNEQNTKTSALTPSDLMKTLVLNRGPYF